MSLLSALLLPLAVGHSVKVASSSVHALQAASDVAQMDERLCGTVLDGPCYGGSHACPASVRNGSSLAALGDDVEVVISACEQPIDYLASLRDAVEAAQLRLARVVVISKCLSKEVANRTLLSTGVDAGTRSVLEIVDSMPNVGRCDHSWASYLNANYASLGSRLVLIKDTWHEHLEHRGEVLSATELLDRGASGFACAFHQHDPWASRQELGGFWLESYDRKWDQSGEPERDEFRAVERTYGGWADSVKLPRSDRFWPICLGGGFATTREAVQRVSRAAWSRIAASLSRGDNIEEGHYMERTWAALLTQPLDARDEKALACAARAARHRRTVPPEPIQGGVLRGCVYEDIEQCRA